MTNTTFFKDQHTPSYASVFEGRLLEQATTPFQDIKIIETIEGNRMMLIDDIVMLSTDTDFVYHEFMVHVPMACIAAPRQVLVIGGGDGGIVTELVRYAGLERIVLAELDGEVIRMSKAHLPQVSSGLADPRVQIEVGDGAAFLAANKGAFDVIIVDSTDVCEEAGEGETPANPLITDAFYADLKAGLKPGGLAMQVLGSGHFYPKGLSQVLTRLNGLFDQFTPVAMPCPYYISGDWVAGLYTDTGSLAPTHIHLDMDKLKYLNESLLPRTVAPPNFVRRLVGKVQTDL